jgi:hypothetical protein
VLGVGLFSADGPLYLWHDFMAIALNQPWEWNGAQPVPNTDIPAPPGVVTADVCRFSGMSPTGACGPTINVPFLDGTVPPQDNVHVNKGGGGGPTPVPDPSGGGGGGAPIQGPCFDIVAELQQDGRAPEMIASARRWADRFVNGEWGSRGDPAKITELGPDRVWLLIGPLRGNSGFGAPICGSGGGPGCPPGNPQKCTPPPSIAPTSAAILDGDPTAAMVTLFAVPAILGAVPLAHRAVGAALRRRRPARPS